MSKVQSIAPFPENISREHFGHWLSGFSDGEGCFILRIARDPRRNYPTPTACFRIGIRCDDLSVLIQIQSFFQCGLITFGQNRRITNAKPVAIYSTTKMADLHDIVMPHFEKFPLRSKKLNDFLIWREAVILARAVQLRKRKWLPGHAANRHGGTNPKWTVAEREHYNSLILRLKQQRIYNDNHEPDWLT